MHLKFLFFPIVLVVCLSIFIGYIWPEIKIAASLSSENSRNKKELQDVADKKVAIEKIGAQLTGNSDNEVFVKSYLPDNKMEERVIEKINYLAANSGVSLLDISPSKNNQIAYGNNSKNSSNANLSMQESFQGANFSQTAISAEDVNFVGFAISVSGEYLKIKEFISQIQRMALFSSIRSFSITNAVEKNSNSNTDVAGLDQSSGSANANLSAEINIGFGYLKKPKFDVQKLSGLDTETQQEKDNATVVALNEYVSQKTPDMTYRMEGNVNPFTPQ